nr:sigma-70 family RNA polymerase sigma factor [Caloranaerobacter azorensis]
MNELKPHYKQVIMLYYYNELSYREISEALEISIGTVKSRLNRAKNILKTEIINSTYRHVHN